MWVKPQIFENLGSNSFDLLSLIQVAFSSAVGYLKSGKTIIGETIKEMSQDSFSAMLNSIADSVEETELVFG